MFFDLSLLNQYSYRDLQSMCKSLNLKANGSTLELQDRLKEYNLNNIDKKINQDKRENTNNEVKKTEYIKNNNDKESINTKVKVYRDPSVIDHTIAIKARLANNSNKKYIENNIYSKLVDPENKNTERSGILSTTKQDINYWLRHVTVCWNKPYQLATLKKHIYKTVYKKPDDDPLVGKIIELPGNEFTVFFNFDFFEKKRIKLNVLYRWINTEFTGIHDLFGQYRPNYFSRSPLLIALRLLSNNSNLTTIKSEYSDLASCLSINLNNKSRLIHISGIDYPVSSDFNILDYQIEQNEKTKGSIPLNVHFVKSRVHKSTHKIKNQHYNKNERENKYALTSIQYNREIISNTNNINYDGLIRIADKSEYRGGYLVYIDKSELYIQDRRNNDRMVRIDPLIKKFVLSKGITADDRIICKIDIRSDQFNIPLGMVVRKKSKMYFFAFNESMPPSIRMFLSLHGIRDKNPIAVGKILVNWSKLTSINNLVSPLNNQYMDHYSFE